jgi:hypothetical protein
MGWNDHDEDVFHGREKFARPSYAATYLISSWIVATAKDFPAQDYDLVTVFDF